MKQKQGSESTELEAFKKKHHASITATKVSKIKLDDKGSVRVAVFLNPEKSSHTVWKMDKGIINNATCADWMITKGSVGDIVVELKGGDVAKALVQITATATYAKANKLLNGRTAGLVLCTQCPAASTKIQRAKNDFARDFKGPIHVRNKSGEFVFEHVLSFNGPERI